FANDSRVNFNSELNKYVYTDTDGVQYEWDDEKGAWFPMWNEYVEQQQSAYNVEGANDEEPECDVQSYLSFLYLYNNQVIPPSLKRKLEGNSEEAKQKEPKKKVNSSVYVTGLPHDVTAEELKEVFSKYGIIMEDLVTGQPKIKIYMDPETNLPKGDALVTYFKEESVGLALQLLDDTLFRPDESNRIRLQQAEFKEKEKAKDEMKRVDKKILKKKREKLERKLNWFEPTGQSNSRFDKIVILKHMFTLEELDKDPAALLDIKEDVRGECEKFGEVTNVILYDNEPDGVMSIRFKEPESAKLCIQFLNGRFFDGKRIEAEIFDGKAKYRKSGGRDDEDEESRIEKYQKWLESGGD
ncbi:hypothetical protein BKA69DRAFT_1016884, partial [Paraphysoderma sedebokerense]